jgi:hypothetical protein
MSKRICLALAAAAAFSGLSATAASAAGCNGVVNPLVWGCAPWDNNNGPKFPYFKKSTVTVPANSVKVEMRNGVPMAFYNGQWNPVVASGSGNLIGPAAGNLIGPAAGNLTIVVRQ